MKDCQKFDCNPQSYFKYVFFSKTKIITNQITNRMVVRFHYDDTYRTFRSKLDGYTVTFCTRNVFRFCFGHDRFNVTSNLNRCCWHHPPIQTTIRNLSVSRQFFRNMLHLKRFERLESEQTKRFTVILSRTIIFYSVRTQTDGESPG